MTHPSQILKPEWIELIKTNAAKAEKDKKLTKKQLDLIYSQDWFRLLTPTPYGGKQKALPEVLQIMEALAWADGSTGWTMGLCAIAGWHGAFIHPEVAGEIFKDARNMVSCSRAASGTAELKDAGFEINGTWLHASGASDASTIIANCIVTKNGTPVLKESNQPQILSFPFYKHEITQLQTWKSMGMLATSSDGFEVKNLIVPTNRAFEVAQDQKVSGKLYHFPYLQLMEAGLAAIISGLTLHFVDLCNEHFVWKTTPAGIIMKDDHVVQGDVDRLMRKFEVAREKLYYGVSLLWQSCVESRPLYPSVLNKVSAATAHLCQISRETINELYPYCGLKVTEMDNEINRVWRDFQTASQHNLLVFGGNHD